MKNHITKVVAVFMAVLMMLSLVPVAALPNFNLPELLSVFGGNSSANSDANSADSAVSDTDASSSDIPAIVIDGESATETEDGTPVAKTNAEGVYIAENGVLYMDTDGDGKAEAISGDTVADEEIASVVTQGKVTNTENYNVETMATALSTTYVNKSYSPYEPVSTNDNDHPFLVDGSAWIDLSEIYYGAPATPNYPLTKWSANTSVYNTTGTGEYYDCGCTVPETDADGYCDTHRGDGKEKYAFGDLDLIDETLWANKTAVVYKDYNDDGTVNAEVTENGVINSADASMTTSNLANTINAKDGAQDTAYAYNRYDAMQGKWGLTVDKNTDSVTWAPSWRANYYGPNATDSVNSSHLYLTDTPYLYYSTEALDSTQVAISLLIGTPVQAEYKTGATTDYSGTYVTTKAYDKDGKEVAVGTADSHVEYVYRWYTITDNIERPGIEANTLDNSMVPNVHVSPIVMENNLMDKNDSIGTTLGYIANGYSAIGWYNGENYDGVNKPAYEVAGDMNRLDPIALAGDDAESLYVNGSITGCIDFTQILPLLMAETKTDANGNTYSNGREAVRYRIAQVRVDSKTDTENYKNAKDSAFRINYLYFGPGLSMVYAPQSAVGSEVKAGNWQYAQNNTNIGEENTDNVSYGLHNTDYAGNSYDSAYTNGWENGDAVSISNTPNNPQVITIDTFGDGNGTLSTVTDAATDKYPLSLSSDYAKSRAKYWDYTITDENGNKKNIRLEAKEAGGQYYTMITIPIRKWINVLGDARKLGFTLTMEKSTSGIEPNFCLWGNDDGSLGSGHSVFGTRFNNEDMLCVFGEGGYYQTDRSDNYTSVLIDETIGKSVIYNTQSVITGYWHDNDEATDYHVYEGTFRLYEKDGVTYYYCETGDTDDDTVAAGNLYYAEQETVTENGVTWYEYVLPSDHSTYVYDPLTGSIRKGSGEAELSMSIDMLSPLWVFKPSSLSVDQLNVVYDETETWVDLLRSPYMFDSNRILTGANTNANIGAEKKGYVFATGLRLAVPVGTKLTIQNMKGDGNSAGLNMYSTSGAIVNAYDGGAGVQPEMEVETNSLTEKFAYYEDNTNDGVANGVYSTHEMQENATMSAKSDNVIKGTQESVPAAYGPFIKGSNYTIYDMLDTEDIKAKGDGATQTVYGIPFKVLSDKLAVYNYPYGGSLAESSSETFTSKNGTPVESTLLGFMDKDTIFMVYGTVDFTDASKTSSKGTETWGLISYGNSEFAWTKLRYNQSYRADQLIYGQKVDGYAQAYSGHVDFAFEKTYSAINGSGADYHYNDTASALISRLQNAWVYTPFTDSGSGWNMVYSTYGTPRLMSTTGEGGTNGVYNIASTKIEIANSTDTKIAYNNSHSGWRSYSIGRTFTPIQLGCDLQGTEKTWPVLYYDFTRMTLTNTNKEYIHFGGVIMSIVVQVNDKDNYLYYLTADGKLSTTKPSSYYTSCGYASFKDIMSGFGYNLDSETNPKIEVVAMNLFYTCNDKPNSTFAQMGSMLLRRFEIWQDETQFLDALLTEDGTVNSADVAVNDKIADGYNIINDAYYYYHDETNDNGSYKKGNSNKGWTGFIQADVNDDGTKEEYYAYDYEDSSYPGLFEYHTALGHLRTWVPAGGEVSAVFKADRSFNTENYRYLYYSYSMRDVESGISAEDNSTDGKGSGVSVAIKSMQTESTEAYIEQENTWIYYGNGTHYLAPDGRDNRTFRTAINAAVDLSTFDWIDSINQLVFYFNNAEDDTAEFYLNYVYLSNVEPDAKVRPLLEETQYQYYYLMDNTGDRYSARFPTIDNPTGQVTGTNSDNDRVNPVIVERGAHLSEGTYFNGDRLYGYGGDSSTNRTFDELTASKGYYEKTYGNDATPNAAENGSMKNILFYAGKDTDESTYTDIGDYYQYKDRLRVDTLGNGKIDPYELRASDDSEIIISEWTLSEKLDKVTYGGTEYAVTSTQANVYTWTVGNLTYTWTDELDGIGDKSDKTGTIEDMLWSYGRWYTGSGEADLNSMYIDDTSERVSGNLTRRYATENYVLLRSGIEPKKFLTYYDADGGQFVYDTSNDTLKDGIQLDENSYYITSTVLFSNFTFPKSVQSAAVEPQKYGFKFMGWYTKDQLEAGGDTAQKKIMKYHRKQLPYINYFYAVWEPDETKTSEVNTANFYVGGNLWNSYDADMEHEFKITLPNVSQMFIDGSITTVAGWRVKDGPNSGKTYSLGQKIVLKETTNFEPIIPTGAEDDPAKNLTTTAKLHGAKLFLVTEMENGKYKTIVDLNKYKETGYHGIQITTDNDFDFTYTNLPRDVVVLAKPLTQDDGSIWMVSQNSNNQNSIYLNGTTGTVVSNDTAEYQFSMITDVDLTYSPIGATAKTKYTDDNGAVSAVVSSTVNTTTKEGQLVREMIFVSQFDLSQVAGAEAVAWGTLYCRNASYGKLSDPYTQMTLNEDYITAERIENGSLVPTDTNNVRQVKATGANYSNQYYLRVTENKGNRVQYFARSYVIYTLNGEYCVAYSNVILREYLDAATVLTTTE